MKFYQIPKFDKMSQASFLLSAQKIDALPLFAQRCEIFEDNDNFYLKSERLPSQTDFVFPPKELTARYVFWNIGPGAKPFADFIVEWRNNEENLKATFVKDNVGRLHLVIRERNMADEVYYQFTIFGIENGMPTPETVFIETDEEWRNQGNKFIMHVRRNAYPYVCRRNGETWIKERKHVRWEKLTANNADKFAKIISEKISQRFIKDDSHDNPKNEPKNAIGGVS